MHQAVLPKVAGSHKSLRADLADQQALAGVGVPVRQRAPCLLVPAATVQTTAGVQLVHHLEGEHSAQVVGGVRPFPRVGVPVHDQVAGRREGGQTDVTCVQPVARCGAEGRPLPRASAQVCPQV